MRRSLRIGLGALALVLGIAPALRADSVFLKLGEIKGESRATGHEGEIDVLSWSWGASNPATIGAATVGVSAGKVSISDLNLMKALDASSPKLFELVTRGTRVPTAVLTLRREPNGYEYLKITLTDVLVSALQLSGSSEQPSESVSLSFAKLLVQYRPQSPSGAPTNWIPASWDLIRLTP